MSVLTIKNCLDPVLRKKCDLIQNINENLVNLSEDMIETMYAATGVGLAANQVGISSRLIVVDLGFEGEKHDPLIIVNPVITASEEEQIGQEGCLSIPEVFADVKRFQAVEVKGVDLNGKDVRLEAEGFLEDPPANPWSGGVYAEGEDWMQYRTDQLAETYELTVFFPGTEEVQFRLDSTKNQSLE